MMRILFAIAEKYPTDRADVAALFGKYLVREEIYSDLLTLHDPTLKPPSWPGGKLLSVPGCRSRFARLIKDMCNDLRILKLAHCGYDAIQVRDKAFCAFIGMISAKFAGIKFYYWMSFPMAEAWKVVARAPESERSFVKRAVAWLRGSLISIIVYRIVLPRADHVFVQSDRMRQDLSYRGIPLDRMTAVPMGYDVESAARWRDKENILTRERPTFVYLGTLSRLRSPDIMIEAIDMVRRSFPNVLLLLIGDADSEAERLWLRNLIDARGLSNHVSITGWVPILDGWSLAAGCLAGLSPYPRGEVYESGSPTKTVEYFGLGLPVIANDQPDQEKVVVGAGGTCVPLTAEGFAARMLDMLTRPEVYEEQGRAGQRWVQAARSYQGLAAMVARVYWSLGKT